MENFIAYAIFIVFFGIILFLLYLALFKETPSSNSRNGNGNILKEIKDRRMAEYDTRQVNAKSFGRKVGSFGEYGLTVTNPVCLTNMNEGLRTYISNLCHRGSGVEKYRIVAVYQVSLFASPVQKVELLMRNTHEVIPMFFSESNYENRSEFPFGFYSYSEYLQNIREAEEKAKRKASVGSREDSGLRFSLRDTTPSYTSFNLRMSERDKQREYLVWKEQKIKKRYTVKTIWEMPK